MGCFESRTGEPPKLMARALFLPAARAWAKRLSRKSIGRFCASQKRHCKHWSSWLMPAAYCCGDFPMRCSIGYWLATRLSSPAFTQAATPKARSKDWNNNEQSPRAPYRHPGRASARSPRSRLRAPRSPPVHAGSGRKGRGGAFVPAFAYLLCRHRANDRVPEQGLSVQHFNAHNAPCGVEIENDIRAHFFAFGHSGFAAPGEWAITDFHDCTIAFNVWPPRGSISTWTWLGITHQACSK